MLLSRLLTFDICSTDLPTLFTSVDYILHVHSFPVCSYRKKALEIQSDMLKILTSFSEL
jgi:hypothetical protein